jgi:hypothetical protein
MRVQRGDDEVDEVYREREVGDKFRARDEQKYEHNATE